MIRKLAPVLIALIGLGGGIAGGLALRPVADDAHPQPDADGTAEAPEDGHDAEGDALPEYVKMNNQFVVPVVEDGRVSAMVVLSLSLEVDTGSTEAVYSREPKLRDAFLQVLFDHANVGGFSGSFTDGSNLIALRTGLKEAAMLVIGDTVKDVLITDIARQDS
jgi:flagellar basal body-associated protein FliL